jgi:hypothetical protein
MLNDSIRTGSQLAVFLSCLVLSFKIGLSFVRFSMTESFDRSDHMISTHDGRLPGNKKMGNSREECGDD